ncbi:MAG: polyphosphate polymerase domain-containing protein [Nitriliruptorales bacterium]|nr:polyphosphate polymerase domain-containing protein [Nitriliruptorales bacterium]
MTTDTGWVRDRQLPAVHLDEVLATAELLDRNDRKYVLQLDDLDELVAAIPADWRVLVIDGRSQQRYRSVYLDDLRLGCFYATARRRPHRSKVRIRSYLDSDLHWLEIKLHDAAGRTVKHRRATTADPLLTDRERAFVRAKATDDVVVDELRPVLTTAYGRSTVLLPSDCGRLTIDRGLYATDADGRSVDTGELVVVETKSPGQPTAADRLLWCHGHRPVAISKYATCLAALHPTLPRNRWHRLLRDRVLPAALPGSDAWVPAHLGRAVARTPRALSWAGVAHAC